MFKRAKREACQQMLVELFHYNQRDFCWDPVGSIDHKGILRLVESIVNGTLHTRSKKLAATVFKSKTSELSKRINELGALL